jgi:DNA-binding MarR family transcriptional regulator
MNTKIPHCDTNVSIKDEEILKLDNQLCFALYVCSKEIIKLYKPLLEPFGLTYTGYITLLALWEKDHVTVKSLGERLYLDSGTLTPLLKKLESKNLLVRERSPEDERNVYITLTEEGQFLKEKVVDVPKELICSSQFKDSTKAGGELLSLLHQFMPK